jgi:hypothetical protein
MALLGTEGPGLLEFWQCKLIQSVVERQAGASRKPITDYD